MTQGKVVCHETENSRHATADQTPHTDTYRDCCVRVERERRDNAGWPASARTAHRYACRFEALPEVESGPVRSQVRPVVSPYRTIFGAP